MRQTSAAMTKVHTPSTLGCTPPSASAGPATANPNRPRVHGILPEDVRRASLTRLSLPCQRPAAGPDSGRFGSRLFCTEVDVAPDQPAKNDSGLDTRCRCRDTARVRCVGLWTVLGLGACASTAQPQVADVTRAAEVVPVCVEDEPAFAPARMPFGFYSVPVERFSALAEAGVTMVGPYYGGPPEPAMLDAADAAGLKVIYPIGFESPEVSEDRGATLRTVVGDAGEHPAVGAWYVLPEELRPWASTELDYLAWVRTQVRAADPDARPMLSYQPNHRRRTELETIFASLDVVTRGLYANFVGAATRRAWVREGAATIVAAARSDQQPWAVLEMFQEPTEPERIAAWVRHDVYASLVAGARGVLVFSGWPRAGFPSYAEYLRAYLAVADELNGQMGLATPLLEGVPSSQVSVELLSGPEQVNASYSETPQMVPSVAARALTLGGATWLYVVNSAERPVRVRLHGATCSPRVQVGPAWRDNETELKALGVSVVRIPSRVAPEAPVVGS